MASKPSQLGSTIKLLTPAIAGFMGKVANHRGTEILHFEYDNDFDSFDMRWAAKCENGEVIRFAIEAAKHGQ